MSVCFFLGGGGEVKDLSFLGGEGGEVNDLVLSFWGVTQRWGDLVLSRGGGGQWPFLSMEGEVNDLSCPGWKGEGGAGWPFLPPPQDQVTSPVWPCDLSHDAFGLTSLLPRVGQIDACESITFTRFATRAEKTTTLELLMWSISDSESITTCF